MLCSPGLVVKLTARYGWRGRSDWVGVVGVVCRVVGSEFVWCRFWVSVLLVGGFGVVGIPGWLGLSGNCVCIVLVLWCVVVCELIVMV